MTTEPSIEPTSSEDNLQNVSMKTEKKSPHPGGRPSKLTEEVKQKAEQYLSEIEAKEDIPYLEQLAYKLDVDMDTMLRWCDDDKEFCGTYKKIQIYQKYCLMKGSVMGQFNPASSIFQLKANHGLIETEKRIQEVNLNYGDLPDDKLDDIIRQKSKEVGATEATE